MTAPEKAAPIPAEAKLAEWDLSQDTGAYPTGPLAVGKAIYNVIGWEGAHRGALLLSDDERNAITAALKASTHKHRRADREARPSLPDSREDDREALARHMAAEHAQHETGYDWELTDRIWQEGWRKAADRALAAMDRARARQGGNNG